MASVIYCDRCHCYCDGARSRLAIRRDGAPESGPDRDLCPAWQASLEAWLTPPAPEHATMTDVKHYCDGCGARIQADRTALTVETGPLRRWAESIDLCPGCAGRLQEWLDAGKTRSPAEGAPANSAPLHEPTTFATTISIPTATTRTRGADHAD